MGYSPSLAARRTLIYGYGSSVTTISSPQVGQPCQPIDIFVHAGAADASGSGLALVSDTLQGKSFPNAIDPPFRSILHLDMVIELNSQGSINYNDYATYYALTSTVNYVSVTRQFEVTSSFYDGSNKSLLTVTDGATFTRLEPGERMGYLFESAAAISNDMVVPYSRLYGWSSISS